MPEPRIFSGRKIVATLVLLLVLSSLYFFNRSFGRICDARATVIIRLAPNERSRIREIRYWPFEAVPNDDNLRALANIPTPGPDGFACQLPYSYCDTGLLWHRRIDTAPLAGRFSAWFEPDDGPWIRREIVTPPPSGGQRIVEVSVIP